MENNDYLEVIKQAYEERIKEIKDGHERIIEDKNERIKDLNEQINYLRKLVDDRENRLIQIYHQYNYQSPGSHLSNTSQSHLGSGDHVAGNKYDQSGANIGGIVDTAQPESNPEFQQHNNPPKNDNNAPEKP